MSASFYKAVTDADIVLSAGVSGDNNAMHINEEFASKSARKGRIAYGMLSGVSSAAIANKLPGLGIVYLSQSLRFKAPGRPGDTVRAVVTVKEVITGKRRALLNTESWVADAS